MSLLTSPVRRSEKNCITTALLTSIDYGLAAISGNRAESKSSRDLSSKYQRIFCKCNNALGFSPSIEQLDPFEIVR